MYSIKTEHGTTISYEKHGSGAPLVLVHGGFSDHRTNWQFVLPFLSQRFTVYAMARRGRGETDATEGHSVEDESLDTAAVITSVGEPVHLLGHSYGALVALGAASIVGSKVRKLVLYEAPVPEIFDNGILGPLITYAQAGDWDAFSYWFFKNVLSVPTKELNALRATELWEPITVDAKASLGDLLAVSKYNFRPARFAQLTMPVLLQIGSESPRHLFATDRLAQILPDVRINSLEGQAHEGMTTAPDQYANAVLNFLTA